MKFLASIKKLMRLSVISKELSKQESEQLQLAISTLMIEMIRADFIELQKEKKIMHDVLTASMDLSEKEADLLIENAEINSDFTISLQSHTAVINNYLSPNEKQTLLKNLWILANIDDELHKLEFNMLNEVATLLGFNAAQLKQICAL
ncbi:MAG TPA: TerB family tellurite resistance protein [Oceanospirillales bacterium]|nr:TerB family tellurite resistance protein [Oceanospirillales bacterium]